MGASLALVHSPLVGPSCWRPAQAALIRLGVRALAIDYGGLVESDGYAGAAARIAGAVTARLGNRWVLAVHSAAGALAPAVFHAASPPPAGVLFVDAALPHPGRSWLEAAAPGLRAKILALAASGRLPPWNRWFAPDPASALITDAAVRTAFEHETPGLPLSVLAAPAPPLALPAEIPKGYLRLSAAYDGELRQTLARSWLVGALEAHHLAMLTDPDRVARAIATMAAAMLGE